MSYRSVEFNVRIGCPIRCGYCPQDKVISSGYTVKTLELDVLSKVLNNASKGGHVIDVVFSGHSEPLSVPNWRDLLSYSHSHPLVDRVVLFSTGYKLTEEDILTLSSMRKITAIWHIGDKDLMPGFDESFIDKIPTVYRLMPKSKFVCVGLDNTFHKLKKVVEEAGASLTFDKVINRAGNLESVFYSDSKSTVNLGIIKKDTRAVTCRYVNDFKRPVVMPDGTTLVCPNDYGSDLVIGNLAKQEWDELDFNRVINLQKTDCTVICKRGCHQATALSP